MCVISSTFQDYCRQIDPDSEEEEVAEVEMAGLRAKGAASEEEEDEFGDSAEDQVWPLTQFFSVYFLLKIIDWPRG